MPRKRETETTSCVSLDERRGHLLARVFYYDSDGRRREYRKRADSKREAKEIIREFELKLKKEGVVAVQGRDRTFREAAAEYEKAVLVPAVIVGGHKVAGLKNTSTPKSILDNVLVPHFGDDRLQDITRPDIEKFRRWRFTVPTWRKEPRTIRTVNYELAVLRQVFYFAATKRWLSEPPQDLFRKLISPAGERKRSRLLTDDEESRLLAACVGPRRHLRPLLVAALDTSLRAGNLYRLAWSDVDFSERVIRVSKTSTKTEQAVTIGLTRRLELELRELFEASDRRPSTLVFGITDNCQHAFKSACRTAGIVGLRFHDLRAKAATSMVAAGLPAEIVRKVTGHANPTVLQEHYIRADVLAARRIAEALDRTRGEEAPAPAPAYVN